MSENKTKIQLHDNALRDGMHTVRHQFSVDEMVTLAKALDDAKVDLIEVSHGDGLGGTSVNYGFAKHSDEEYLRAVIGELKYSRVSALLIPGIGTVKHLEMAHDCGIQTIRVATHCTEADVSEQHIQYARKLDLDTVGFLMMSHMISGEKLLEQAQKMVSYGANCIYATDSAGYLLPAGVTERVGALKAGLPDDIEIGFHGHHNMAMGVANSIAAVEAGASRIDGSVAGFGAGAGNTPLEVFAVVCDRMGIDTGVILDKLVDAAEDVAIPMMENPTRVDRDSLVLGYAGVYSSFLLHAQRAEEKHGVPAREILVELGKRKTVGGQEDMIEDVALDILKQKNKLQEAV